MTESIPQLLESRVPMPLILLPVCSPVIPLTEGRVLLSPGSHLSEAQLRTAGPLTDVVAPSLLHMGGVARAMREHPRARVWGPPGARERRPEIPWTHELGTDAWPHQQELPFVQLEGMPKVNEAVFFHRASRTLFAGDLVFNIEPPGGFRAWLLLVMFGVYRKLGMSFPFRFLIRDREAFRRSAAELLALSFTDLVPTHGAPVQGDAKERLRSALAAAGYAV